MSASSRSAREPAPVAEIESLLLAHPERYVRALEEASPEEGLVQLDNDTSMSPHTLEAAMRAVGGAILAVDEVVTRKVQNAFVGSRPPGHHAETATAMGFCLFNNAAIAARHARKAYGLDRVAIVDWDVHHGNGTQDIFWDDPTSSTARRTRCRSIPAPARSNERGEHDNIVNVPLRAGDGGDAVPRGVRGGASCRALETSGRTCSSSRPASTRTCAIRWRT